jgi:hypothetical protein
MAALLASALSACVSNQSKPESEAAPAVSAAAERASQPVAPKAEEKPVCKDDIAKTKSKMTATSNTKAKAKGKAAATASQPADCVPVAEAAAVQTAASAPANPVVNGAYDLSKNKPVTDSTKVEAGQGTQVKGINDWQGEISGVPAANSRFAKLKIGMSQKQVADLIGEPTDQGAYVTGKAFIPFYFGSDRSRWEMIYKGQGRLIFSNQSGFGSGFYLTWIIHNSNEPGYR